MSTVASLRDHAHSSLLRELETSIRDGSHLQRVSTLRRVTDLFVYRAEQYDNEQVKLFDDVIVRLSAEIEKTALAELANRLAPIPNAPPETVRTLARDPEVAVAGPLLSHSLRLADDDLVDIARAGSQAHLLAIGGREHIAEPVTDVLVERGGSEVAHKIVANGGARFSESGFARLVDRAGEDETLAVGIGARVDIPPHLFRRLVTEATERVQGRLIAVARPEVRPALEQLLVEIAEKVGANSEIASRGYSAACSYVRMLAQSNRLGTHELTGFAKAGRFEETVAALAELAEVPVDIVDRVMHGEGIDPVLVLCRAKNFDWAVVRAVLIVRRNCRVLSAHDLEQACQDYKTLSASTAERVLRFWQVRRGK
ncbi:MAG TPA: DUF2336 domain-containing protein [Xanthobacteraceae bacterium]|nr:DUF2336 domain-containing protein [Xanthobacteraceae bacterium]